MNTVLIVMVLSGRFWVPSYAVVYPTEKACMAEAEKEVYKGVFATKKASCLPQVVAQ